MSVLHIKFVGLKNKMTRVGFARVGSVVSVSKELGEHVLLRFPEDWVHCTEFGDVVADMTISELRAYGRRVGNSVPSGLSRRDLIAEFLFGDPSKAVYEDKKEEKKPKKKEEPKQEEPDKKE